MKKNLAALIILLFFFPEFNFAQTMSYDTLYIVNAQGSLTSSPNNYLHNNHDEFKEFRLTFNVLESEEEWQFVYSDWCCDIQVVNLIPSYNVPLEAGDSSLIKIGVFWNDQLSGYGVVELIFEETNAPTTQAKAIFIIDVMTNSTSEILNQRLELFPNPTSANLFFNEIDNCSDIFIYNNLGEMVASQPCGSSNEIITSKLSTGMYFVYFRDVNHKIVGNASFVKI